MLEKTFKVVWLQAGGCGGCSLTAFSADEKGLVGSLKPFGIELLWHPALSEETGREVLEIIEKTASGKLPFDALCIEGAVLRGPNGTGRFQMLAGTKFSMAYWIKRLAEKARYVVAVGSCAAFGGIPAGDGNITEATGLQYEDEHLGGLLGDDFKSGAGLPVINVAGCAPHPGWITETLSQLALGDFNETELDSLKRPRFFADHLAHHGCSRNEYYEFKASAGKLSDQGCLMENLGCKATQAPGDCNLRVWNGSNGSCPDAGYPCINCTSPGFENPPAAFQVTPKVGGIPVGLPMDMPKAWFVALAALSKSATPHRVKRNSRSDHVIVPPARRNKEE